MKRIIGIAGLSAVLITGAAGSAFADHPKPDPQPTHGQDCDPHGNGGVNNDHCQTPTPSDSSTSPTTPAETSSTSSSSSTSATSTPPAPSTTTSVVVHIPSITSTGGHIKHRVHVSPRPHPPVSSTTKTVRLDSARPAVDELAFTGTQSLALTGLAGGLLIAGSGAHLVRRRQEARH